MPFILLTPGRDPRTTRCYLATNRRVGGKVRRAKQSLGEFHAPGVFYAEGIVLLERQIASAYGDASIEALERRRDRQQVSVLRALAGSADPDSQAEAAPA